MVMGVMRGAHSMFHCERIRQRRRCRKEERHLI